ncbi:hypothetical protein AHAS_Ahas15G0161800 [Arachis hypogaea]
MSLDHSAGGSIHMRKTIDKAQELIETVASNQHLYSSSETSMKEEAKTVSTESNPPEQMLQEIRASNKNIKARSNQAEQHLSERIKEECLAIQLRSGRTLNTQPQNSKKQGQEEIAEYEQAALQGTVRCVECPERDGIGVQRPEGGGARICDLHNRTGKCIGSSK